MTWDNLKKELLKYNWMIISLWCGVLLIIISAMPLSESMDYALDNNPVAKLLFWMAFVAYAIWAYQFIIEVDFKRWCKNNGVDLIE